MTDMEERMSPDVPLDSLVGATLLIQPPQTSPSDQPRDLSIRRKMKPVPPPLDLSKRTLDHQNQGLQTPYIPHPAHIQSYGVELPTSPSLKSPLLQKNLPLRKRAFSWSSQPGQLTISNSTINTALSSTITTIKDEEYEPADDYSYTKSSSNSSLRIAGLPTPHTPHTPHPHSAIPVLTSRFNFSEGSMQSSGPLNLSSTATGIPSSLLSPAPSHPSTSSLSSSREELETEAMITEGYHGYPHTQYTYQHYSTALKNSNQQCTEIDNQMCNMSYVKQEHITNSSGLYVHEEVESRPHSSGLYRIKDEEYAEEHADYRQEEISYETPALPFYPSVPTVWSVLLAGVRVHFVIKKEGEQHPQVTNGRLSDELALLEKSTAEVYAPNGVLLLQCLSAAQMGERIEGPEDHIARFYFRPVNSTQEDIIALAPANHPFFVHKKGWCSFQPEECERIYGIACCLLSEGDVCVTPPPTHTPSQTSSNPHHVYSLHQLNNTSADSVAEAFRRIDFSDDTFPQSSPSYDPRPSHPSFSKLSPVSEISTYQPPPTPYVGSHPSLNRSVILSPPASPSKKVSSRCPQGFPTETTPSGSSQARPRRPMNGFMLFAKHHRLRLIQQHPGKDNRAISVLLGATWKGLPDHEREKINTEARIQAEAMKRVDPDCWKRKRSHSTS